MDFDPVIDSALSGCLGAPLCHALDLDASSVRSRVRRRRAARTNVVSLPVQGSAAARPAADRTQGLACAG
jgi:hypothetical protein